MNLISDTDLRKVLKIKKDEGEWILNSVKNFFGIEEINQIYKDNLRLSGPEFIDSVITRLGIKYTVTEDYERKIPSSGPFIIIANHPFGGLEGILLLKLISRIRPDFKLQGNFLVQHIKAVKDYILPVNPFENFKSAHSSYKGLKDSYKHLKQGGSLAIFPAGEVSAYQFKENKITDRQWQKLSVKFIKSAGVPVIPVHFQGSNSTMFHILGHIHPMLRTAKLPSELLNKSNKNINIEFRDHVPVKTILSFSSIDSLSHYLRAKTYSLSGPVKTEKFFRKELKLKENSKKKIIDPVNQDLILADLLKLDNECFLFSNGSLSVYCAPYSAIPNAIREIGRLREITFREVGEGTNKAIDLDEYDLYYNHLIIWDHVNKRIAGSYRIGKGKDIMNEYGKKGFYISSLFRLKKGINHVLGKSIELGRSFIIKDYQRHPLALFLLWKGILWYLLKNPEYQYLIGPVSISNDFSKRSKSLIVLFVRKHYYDSSFSSCIVPRKGFRIPGKILIQNTKILDNVGNNIKTLELYIRELQPGLVIPVLMKKYLQMNGKIIAFNVDPEFSNCLDSLMIVKISDIPQDLFSNLTQVQNKE